MYKNIRSHPSPIKIYGEKLVNKGLLNNEELNHRIKNFKRKFW